MLVLGFGGGVDSTGILAGWHLKGLQHIDPIEMILFADTGGERPHTYEHIDRMQNWLWLHGFPPVTVVKKGGRQETLEENCLRKKTLPSIAFGHKKCSHVFKIEAQERYLNRQPSSKAWWGSGRKVRKLIGYEFREERRWAKAAIEDDKYVYEYPLVQWEWSRPECADAIRKVGIPVPGKSACFYCPSSTKPEIDDLKQTYPLLFQRAILMEDNARKNLKTVKGLGRRFSWRDYAVTTEEPDVQPCMVCQDG